MRLNIDAIDLILARKVMSKSDLARRCGISKQNVSTILNRGFCGPKTAGKIACGLDVDVSEITDIGNDRRLSNGC